MVKVFNTLIVLSAMALVVIAAVLFSQTERQSRKLNDIKPTAEANFLSWEKENNCIEDPLPCADYSTQFKNWLSQFEIYKKSKDESPEFQAYFFLKELDERYIPSLNSGGKASLALSCVLLLLWSLLIVYLLGGKKKTKVPYIKTKLAPKLTAPKPIIPKPKEQANQAKTVPKPDSQALLRKAAECAESEPLQAINYLEQAIEGSLSTKLAAAALLMCGSLRLKNKIGEEQGVKYLKKIISDAPQSLEAEKAKTVLDMFK